MGIKGGKGHSYNDTRGEEQGGGDTVALLVEMFFRARKTTECG